MLERVTFVYFQGNGTTREINLREGQTFASYFTDLSAESLPLMSETDRYVRYSDAGLLLNHEGSTRFHIRPELIRGRFIVNDSERADRHRRLGIAGDYDGQ